MTTSICIRILISAISIFYLGGCSGFDGGAGATGLLETLSDLVREFTLSALAAVLL